MAQRQQTMGAVIKESEATESLPKDTTVFVAPKNNTIKPFTRVEAPHDLLEREALFARSVALALGMPGGIAWQVLSLPQRSRSQKRIHSFVRSA
jgi:hypothetical protein